MITILQGPITQWYRHNGKAKEQINSKWTYLYVDTEFEAIESSYQENGDFEPHGLLNIIMWGTMLVQNSFTLRNGLI